MSEVPATVRDAIAPVDVEDATCLEAGAGVGNMTEALREAGARRVLAVTDDPAHATGVRERVAGTGVDVIRADLRAIPCRAASVSVVTAHALCNVLSPAALDAVFSELSRVATRGASLVIVDYDPLPPGVVAEVIGVENAVAHLTDGTPAYSFYPASLLTDLLRSRGWTRESHRTLLDPVPWPRSLLEDHAALAREGSEALPGPLQRGVNEYLDSLMRTVEEEVRVGRYYALVFRRS